MGNELKTSTGQFADHNAVMQRCLHDPVFFVREILGGDPWEKQEEVLRAVATYDRVTVRSCHGVGKTRCAAWVVLWFLFTHKDSVVITTAPTYQQVETILWREIKSIYALSKFPLGNSRTRMLNTELNIGEKWFAIGISTDKPERFQGYHAESGDILLVVDESSGVEQAIFDAAEGFLTSAGSKMMLIGNPTRLYGEFRNSFTTPLYHKIHISAWDSPNLKAGHVVRPYLITSEWVNEKREQWGVDSPLWYSRVLGEFPTLSDDTVFPLADILAAQQRHAAGTIPTGLPIILAADIARFGADSTCITLRRGNKADIYKQLRKFDTMEVTGFIVGALAETGAIRANVDVSGLGAGVVDRLKELGKPVMEMDGGKRASDPARFINKRAEWYWNMRTLLHEGIIAIPDREDITAQMCGIKYSFDSQGRIRIESKDDMKKAGRSSPDACDSLVYVFANVKKNQFFIGRA